MSASRDRSAGGGSPSSREVVEADGADIEDQRRPVGAEPGGEEAGGAGRTAGVPDADAADVEDQRRPVGADAGAPAAVHPAPEVPEADAWEQAIEVPLDDEAERQ